MANRYKIMLRPLDADHSVPADVQDALGATLVAGDEGSEWEGRTATAFVLVRNDHGLESVPGLPYESHPWSVTLRDRENYRERELEVAEELYGKLVDSRRYSCFLTDGVAKLLQSDVVP